MWRKEDGRPQNPNEISTSSMNPTTSPALGPANSKQLSSVPTSSNGVASLSPGIRIKGEITGSEDLFIDGNVEGKVTFHNAVLTVGPNANVKADIDAREARAYREYGKSEWRHSLAAHCHRRWRGIPRKGGSRESAGATRRQSACEEI